MTTHPITAANGAPTEAAIVLLARFDDDSEASGMGAHPGEVTGMIGELVSSAVAAGREQLELLEHSALLVVTIPTAIGYSPTAT